MFLGRIGGGVRNEALNIPAMPLSFVKMHGAGNDYVMHSIVTMTEKLRANPGKFGLCTGNGWYVTKHSAGIYSTKPVEGDWQREDPKKYQVEIDAKNIMQLFRQLGQKFPELGAVLEDGFAVAIDGEMYEDQLLQPIKPDAEVVLIPKIAGG